MSILLTEQEVREIWVKTCDSSSVGASIAQKFACDIQLAMIEKLRKEPAAAYIDGSGHPMHKSAIPGIYQEQVYGKRKPLHIIPSPQELENE